MEKPPDVVGDVPHVPRDLATTYTVVSNGVCEGGGSVPDFKLSPGEEEIVVENIEQRLPWEPEIFDGKFLLGPC